MSELLKINVNDHVEKKQNLSYLSWAWAWAEVLKIDPNARWHAFEYSDERGCALPCMFLPDGSAMVKTEVTIKGETKTCVLPVMDHRNKAIKQPDAFAINTAIMRCMTKAISMHGLGLYIYAGEDLPEGEEPPKKEEKQDLSGIRHSPLKNDEVPALPPEVLDYIKDLAKGVTDAFRSTDTDWHAAAVQQIKSEGLDDLQKMTLWAQLDSKTRSAFKKVEQELHKTKEPA